MSVFFPPQRMQGLYPKKFGPPCKIWAALLADRWVCLCTVAHFYNLLWNVNNSASETAVRAYNLPKGMCQCLAEALQEGYLKRAIWQISVLNRWLDTSAFGLTSCFSCVLGHMGVFGFLALKTDEVGAITIHCLECMSDLSADGFTLITS